MENSSIKIVNSRKNSSPLNEVGIPKARIISISSGKGGVGKTNICTNLAIALSKRNKRVCIFDADMGLANINILIGKNPKFTIEHFLSGKKKMEEIMMDGPEGIKIIPAASGIEKFIQLSTKEQNLLLLGLEEIEKKFDYILIDTSAGVSINVLSFIMSSQETFIVVTPEPTSLTDAYSLMKVLRKKWGKRDIYLLVNMVFSYQDSIKIHNRINNAAKKYLSLNVKYLGYILMDQALPASVIQQTPIIISKPRALISRCFSSVAEKIETVYHTEGCGTLSEYWSQFIPNQDDLADEDKNVVITTPPGISKNANGNDNSIIDNNLMDYSNFKDHSFNDLSKKVNNIFKNSNQSEIDSLAFIKSLIEIFENKFNKPPYQIKDLLYSSLDRFNFSKEKIRELYIFLELIFEKRFNHSIYDLNDLFIRILEDSSNTENEMNTFLGKLENSFRKRFNKPFCNVKELVQKELINNNFNEKYFIELVESVGNIYEKRFGTPLIEVMGYNKKEIINIVEKMEKDESDLKSLSNNITDAINKHNKRKNLLKKLISE